MTGFENLATGLSSGLGIGEEMRRNRANESQAAKMAEIQDKLRQISEYKAMLEGGGVPISQAVTGKDSGFSKLAQEKSKLQADAMRAETAARLSGSQTEQFAAQAKAGSPIGPSEAYGLPAGLSDYGLTPPDKGLGSVIAKSAQGMTSAGAGADIAKQNQMFNYLMSQEDNINRANIEATKIAQSGMGEMSPILQARYNQLNTAIKESTAQANMIKRMLGIPVSNVTPTTSGPAMEIFKEMQKNLRGGQPEQPQRGPIYK